MQLMECSQADDWSIPGLDMTWGDWAGDSDSDWACAKIPHLGTVTKVSKFFLQDLYSKILKL